LSLSLLTLSWLTSCRVPPDTDSVVKPKKRQRQEEYEEHMHMHEMKLKIAEFRVTMANRGWRTSGMPPALSGNNNKIRSRTGIRKNVTHPQYSEPLA